MGLKIADRSAVDAFRVMDVMRAARSAEQAGRAVYHLEVGQPGTPAPLAAREAVKQALDNHTLGYTLALGTDELRAGISTLYQQWYGVDVPAARITVTQGASGGFALAFLTAFDAGDRVALATPGYPCYRNILSALDLEAVEIMTGPDTHYQPTVAALEALDGPIDGLILASPSNPTGSMLSPEDFGAINDWCQNNGVRLISDEIYHGLTYGTPETTAAAINDDAFVINSFSKYFSMTGWRVGWMVVPEDHVRVVERLAQNLFICPPHASQVAALAAMDCTEELEANMDVYRVNRQLMLDGLPAAGFDRIAPPDGAFYVYADVSHLTDDSVGFAKEILEQAGVAVTPGLDFDPLRGGGTLRFSYARSTADIEEGLARLRDFMSRRRS